MYFIKARDHADQKDRKHPVKNQTTVNIMYFMLRFISFKYETVLVNNCVSL